MTVALAKWTAALNTFDSIKTNFRAPAQVEKALHSIALDERVLLFRGSVSDIVERLSAYDQLEGECCQGMSCLSLSLDVCISALESGLQATFCQQCTCLCICVYHTLEVFDSHSRLKAFLAGWPSVLNHEH